MTNTEYPEYLLNLENIGIHGSVLKLKYHELPQKFYDAIKYGYTRGQRDASTANKSDDVGWTNFTELVNGTASHRIDYTKLDGRRVKIVGARERFIFYSTLEMDWSMNDSVPETYFLCGFDDREEILEKAWYGEDGFIMYVEGNILKKQRTADKLSVGERVSLRSLVTDEVWKDAVCVASGNIISYSDKSGGLELLDEDLVNIVVEEEIGLFDISEVAS